MGKTRPADPGSADDELRILRWLDEHGAATLKEIRHHFAARMGERARRAAERLRKIEQASLVDGKYTITDAGRVRTSTPRSRLPVLPDPVTPHGGFLCTRLGVGLKVEQCAVRYGTRGDDVCGRDAAGVATKEGCPVGAEAVRALEAYRERTVGARFQELRKARAA